MFRIALLDLRIVGGVLDVDYSKYSKYLRTKRCFVKQTLAASVLLPLFSINCTVEAVEVKAIKLVTAIVRKLHYVLPHCVIVTVSRARNRALLLRFRVCLAGTGSSTVVVRLRYGKVARIGPIKSVPTYTRTHLISINLEAVPLVEIRNRSN